MKTANKRIGRRARALPASFSPEQIDYINRRVTELKPKVSSRSHYLQMLVEADRQGLVPYFPKRKPAHQTAGEFELAA